MITSNNSATDKEVDVLVVGSGTGMAAALAAHEQGLNVLVVEKTEYVGGSTALSGGGIWLPANDVLKRGGSLDTVSQGLKYTESVVGDTSPEDRWTSVIEHGPDTIAMLERTTDLSFMWSRGYSDYHPENPGGHAVGRTIEANPFDAASLGEERGNLRPTGLEAPVPMPITSADYRWMNLVAKKPTKGIPKIAQRVIQGIGGKVIGREYIAGGEALAAGLFGGLIKAGIPVWTEAALDELIVDGDRVVGAKITQAGKTVTVGARRGVIMATGGFDHDMEWRHEYQIKGIENWSLGNPGNTGDGIKAAQSIGADIALMDQAWWFPAKAPLPGEKPSVLLAERSLPGSFIINQDGQRFINEASDYMTFGQTLQRKEREGNPVKKMWIIFDQEYRNSYVFAAGLFPRMPIPQEWFDGGIAFKGNSPTELATAMGIPERDFAQTLAKFNRMAAAGIDSDFNRGGSAYDRYYGDPTVTPNPNLRPLVGKPLYAVEVVLSDLGTCGGIKADARGRALNPAGDVIDGLYAIGNTAGNAFGETYPGAGATIGQGLTLGYVAALDAAGVEAKPAIA